jgi:hypothetical protein
MYLSQSGNNNIAIGSSAMYYNITGDNNIAIGREALSEQIGPGPSGGIGGYAENNNIAIGFQALRSFSGVYNVAVGIGSMSSASGWGNVSIGYGAIQGVNGFGNTAVGYGAGSQSSWTGNYNTFIGYGTTAAQFSGTTYHGTVAIGTDSGGAGARASANNQIVFGTSGHTASATQIAGNTVNVGAWVPYIPVVTSNVSPTYGTGGGIKGSYCVVGKTVHFKIQIYLGTSPGVSGATTNWQISLPPLPAVYAVATDQYGAIGSAAGQSAGTGWMGTAVLANSTNIWIMYPTAVAGAVGYINGTVPRVWANGDLIKVTGTYETT